MTWQPKQNVVVPIDFSDATQEALTMAAECAFENRNIHVVHVVWAADPFPEFNTWNANDLAVRRETAQKKIEEMLEANDMCGAVVSVLAGDPGQQIVEYTEEIEADLVVIPSHGYSGLKRLLLGSTAERVVRHASCPVYVLRRPDAE